MKIMVLLFEGPISKNNEQRNIANSLPVHLWQKRFFIYFFDSYENIDIMFQGPISNHTEKKKYCPFSPWDAPGKNYFLNFFE